MKQQERLICQNVQQFFQLRLLRIVGVTLEVAIKPDGGGLRKSAAGQHQSQIAL